jgi:hypothetical protein
MYISSIFYYVSRIIKMIVTEVSNTFYVCRFRLKFQNFALSIYLRMCLSVQVLD